MSRHDDTINLRQMLDHARETVELVTDRSRSDLDTDRLLSLALVQLLQIVGEAAGRVSQMRQQRHSEIPWNQIIALRNRLIHGYDTIDYEVLWQIITTDLPDLVSSLENIDLTAS